MESGGGGGGEGAHIVMVVSRLVTPLFCAILQDVFFYEVCGRWGGGGGKSPS